MACWAVTSRGAAVGDMRSQVYRGISHCSQRLSAGWLRKVQLSQFHWAPSKSSSLCARGGGSSAGSTETGHSVAASYSPWKHQCCKHFSPRKHQWVQMLYFKTTSKRLNAILEGHINAANSVLQRGINGYFKKKKKTKGANATLQGNTVSLLQVSIRLLHRILCSLSTPNLLNMPFHSVTIPIETRRTMQVTETKIETGQAKNCSVKMPSRIELCGTALHNVQLENSN